MNVCQILKYIYLLNIFTTQFNYRQAMSDATQQRGLLPGTHAGQEAPEQLGVPRRQGGQGPALRAAARKAARRAKEICKDRLANK